jgi:carbon dioxide concentrating mechanism protein CcmN
MYLPPVQPVSNAEIYVSGDVKIHPSAVLAPGTILQAAPNSQIVIGASACLGMGVILKAYQGVIEVKQGAVLGAGVLIIGKGEIGDQACVGASTTVYNTSIKAKAVIPAGSLLGDISRQDQFSAQTPISSSVHEFTPAIKAESYPESVQSQETNILESPWDASSASSPVQVQEDAIEEAQSPPLKAETIPVTQTEIESTAPESEPSPTSDNNPIVGQVYINQLLLTLFPEGHYLNRRQSNDQ